MFAESFKWEIENALSILKLVYLSYLNLMVVCKSNGWNSNREQNKANNIVVPCFAPDSPFLSILNVSSVMLRSKYWKIQSLLKTAEKVKQKKCRHSQASNKRTDKNWTGSQYAHEWSYNVCCCVTFFGYLKETIYKCNTQGSTLK